MSLNSLSKEGEVDIGFNRDLTTNRRAKHAQNTESKVFKKTPKNALGSSKIVQSFARQWDVDLAFRELTQLVRSGVVRPSKYGIQNWTLQQFDCLPSQNDVTKWQAKWLKMELIRPVRTPNGKTTYKLKVEPKNQG